MSIEKNRNSKVESVQCKDSLSALLTDVKDSASPKGNNLYLIKL
jgi:hypothetical protein